MELNELTSIVIREAIDVHRKLGPGLLESVYESCLVHRLRILGLKVQTQKPIPVIFEGVKLECGYRCDIVVEDILILEIKSCDGLSDIHFAQALTYLRLSGMRLALLINFNVLKLKDGIRRIINGY